MRLMLEVRGMERNPKQQAHGTWEVIVVVIVLGKAHKEAYFRTV
jgi:hypothetical protein